MSIPMGKAAVFSLFCYLVAQLVFVGHRNEVISLCDDTKCEVESLPRVGRKFTIGKVTRQNSAFYPAFPVVSNSSVDHRNNQSE